jgi:hypothetical protein
MDDNIKHIIKQEYLKCASDPIHFMKKYCFIQHPQYGRIKFDLYPFQEKVLKLFADNPYTFILKSRQLGLSTLTAGYSLWMMTFHKDKNILCVATKQDTAKNMVTKVKFMYDNLPSWMKVGTIENNKLTLKLTNGSQIKAVSAASDAGRSESVSLLLVDEAAFIDNIEDIWTSSQQTLATGGGCIILSTPNGIGNWFHVQYVKAEEGTDSKFLPIKLPWFVHPDRNQAWRDEQDVSLGKRMAAQECFSGDTIIYTKEGPKFIKDIQIGDVVLSHDGTYNKVIRTFSKVSTESVEIKGGINNIQKFTTLNHPFYNEYDEFEEVNSLMNSGHMVNLFPKVKYPTKPKTIDLSKYITSNSPKHFPLKVDSEHLWLTKTSKVNKKIKFDYDLGFLVGCFLSEGSLAKNKVEFSFNGETEREGFPLEIERILEDKFNINNFSYYTSKRWGGSSKLYIKDQIFNNFIQLCIQGGKLSYEKSLSSFFYQNANLETLRGIMDGVLVGDGMLKKEYNISLLLTSQKLIYDILYITNLLGIHNVTIKEGESRNPRNPSTRPNYTLTWGNSKIDSSSKIFSDRIKHWDRKNTIGKSNSNSNFKFTGTPYVKLKINPNKSTQVVYNIEVESTHTYVTEYGVVHNCDCDFSTSGDTVFLPEWLEYIRSTTIEDPIEKRGVHKDLWIWEPAFYDREYLVTADVARGDGKDYSTAQVFDVETMVQVAEYKGHLSPKEFGYFLVGLATEYNNALLAPENASIAWSTLDSIIERQYTNLYYSAKSDNFTAESYDKYYENNSSLVPGFTNSTKTRPLCINKFREMLRENCITIKSQRLYEEMKVFLWINGKPQARGGYNDDLVMAVSINTFLRDTTLRYQQKGLDMVKSTLGSFQNNNTQFQGFNHNSMVKNPYQMEINGQSEDIRWLLKK